MVKFDVDNVQTGVKIVTQSSCEYMKKKLSGTIESFGITNDDFIGKAYCGYPNEFLNAVNLAFRHHYPLIISPDMIWITIMHGIAQHINKYPVNHADKKLVNIQRDDFIKGSFQNDWSTTVDSFIKFIKSDKKLYEILDTSFTTSKKHDIVAMRMTLMETVKSYYNYSVTTFCGIPWIDVQGTLSDWDKIMTNLNIF